MFIIDISQRIKFLRKIHDISQDELASGILASRGNVGDWERGKAKPGADALIALSRFFKISTDFILTGKINLDRKTSAAALGEKILELRTKRNLDPDSMSERLEIPIQEYIDYEEGKVFPTDHILVALSIILDCDLECLLDENSIAEKTYYVIDNDEYTGNGLIGENQSASYSVKDNASTIGSVLRTLREKKKISIMELAEKTHIEEDILYMIEASKKPTKPDIYARILDALGEHQIDQYTFERLSKDDQAWLQIIHELSDDDKLRLEGYLHALIEKQQSSKRELA